MATISVVTFGNNDGQDKVLPKDYNHAESNTVILRQSSIENKSLKKIKNDITRVSNPTKIAVTRRNARERNRVKQVNNGFITLRQHIPSEIAAAFESGNGRGNNKKLSKVETLRMAVEYIRTLKEILSNDHSRNSSISSGTSVISFPPTVSSIPKTSQYNSDDVKLLKVFQQYVRIPGTDTYQLTNTFTYEDEENIKPLTTNISTGSNAVEFPLTDKVFEENIFSTNIGSPYSNENSVCSPGDTAAGSIKSYSNEQIQTLPPIEVLQSRSVIHNNLVIHPSLSSNNSISSNCLSSNLTLVNHTSVISTLSNSSIYSSEDSDYIKSETLSDHSDLSFGNSVVKTEEMVDVIDWWENTKLTSIES